MKTEMVALLPPVQDPLKLQKKEENGREMEGKENREVDRRRSMFPVKLRQN